MTMDAGSWTLRPAGPADEPFLLALYVDVRAAEFQGMGWPPEVLAAFLADQWRMQTRAYAHAHPQADLSIVEQDGVAVGRLLLSRTSSDHRIVDISLMSHVRGRGLGGQVLAGVCDRADASDCEQDSSGFSRYCPIAGAESPAIPLLPAYLRSFAGVSYRR